LIGRISTIASISIVRDGLGQQLGRSFGIRGVFEHNGRGADVLQIKELAGLEERSVRGGEQIGVTEERRQVADRVLEHFADRWQDLQVAGVGVQVLDRGLGLALVPFAIWQVPGDEQRIGGDCARLGRSERSGVVIARAGDEQPCEDCCGAKQPRACAWRVDEHRRPSLSYSF
jgi:hypothetical protein